MIRFDTVKMTPHTEWHLAYHCLVRYCAARFPFEAQHFTEYGWKILIDRVGHDVMTAHYASPPG